MTKQSQPRNNSDRRTFLKQGAVTSAAVGSSLILPKTSFARSVHVGESNTIRLGIIGCGGRGTQAVTQAMNTESGPVQLTAMGDIFESRLKNSYDSIAGMEQYKDKMLVDDDHKFVGFDAYEKVLASDVDMVVLTTPPGFRPLHFEKAIEAGKHVFMEKPVAVDAPGVRRVLAANKIAKEKGLMVGVGLQRRHERAYMETISRLKDGEIGDINFTRAYWNGTTPWVRHRTKEQTELEYQLANWYFFNWICGDHIVEQHIHNLDVINWLKDAYPVKAQGQGGREIRRGKDHGQIFDHHFVEFTYEDGSTMLSQCRHMDNTWTEVAEFAHGSEGDCNIRHGRIRKDGEVVWRTQGSRGGHQQEHHDWFRDLRDGRIPNEGDYGALSTMTAIFGRMATYTGKQLTWDQAFNSELSLANVDDMKSFDDVAPVQPLSDGTYPVPVPGVSWEDVL